MAVIFEIRASLRGITPEIFRIIRVKSDISLQLLHEVFQATFTWENFHLHFFRLHDGTFIKREDSTKLHDVLEQGKPLVYVYDYGDSWTIDVSLLRLFDDTGESNYPVCIDGARQSPPEDSGGITGYELALEFIGKKSVRDYPLITEWYGEEFNPEHFSVEEVNKQLLNIVGV